MLLRMLLRMSRAAVSISCRLFLLDTSSFVSFVSPAGVDSPRGEEGEKGEEGEEGEE